MATLNDFQYDVLHNKLGWTNNAIQQMGQATAEDIFRDWMNGIERGPTVALQEPEDAATAAFLGGITTDVEDISLALRGGLQRAGEAAGEIGESLFGFLKDAPYILIGVAVLYILARK